MEFLNNEDVKHLYVYLKSALMMVAARTCANVDNADKGIFFIKISNASKLTYEQMSKLAFNDQLIDLNCIHRQI